MNTNIAWEVANEIMDLFHQSPDGFDILRAESIIKTAIDSALSEKEIELKVAQQILINLMSFMPEHRAMGHSSNFGRWYLEAQSYIQTLGKHNGS
jgi:hypothetical protein